MLHLMVLEPLYNFLALKNLDISFFLLLFHTSKNINIFDFKLTNEEMAEISQLNKNEPFYVRTDEALKRFASWVPDAENQK